MTPEKTETDSLSDDRRKFLASCGKFAVVTPPAITLLLSTSLNSTAVARSGGGSNGDHHDNDRHDDDRDRDDRHHHGRRGDDD
jgi:hypothetical protein